MEGRSRKKWPRAPSPSLSLAVFQALSGEVSCPTEVTVPGRGTQLGQSHATKAGAEPPPPVQALPSSPPALLKQLRGGQDVFVRAWNGRKGQQRCLGKNQGHTQHEREPSSK